jgi:hypothetical protein
MFKKFFISMVSVGLAASLAACGGDDDDGGNPDAAMNPDAPQADAGADGGVADAMEADAFMHEGSPSCDELATPSATLTTFPATHNGDLAGKLANLSVAGGVCTNENAPVGVTAPGPDEVIKLTGLTPNTKYYAKITNSTDDLNVYVITGCMNGEPGTGQCLAFADAGFTGDPEAAVFTAPVDGTAYVVVDFWNAEAAPASTTYTLTVTTEGCVETADCTVPTAPFCDTTTFTCGTYDACVGDDANEAASDDGPAGATLVTPAPGMSTSVNAKICNDQDVNQGAATLEFDWYKIVVPQGGGFTASAAWMDAAADLDVYVLDANLTTLGFSFWKNPEQVKVNHLAAGTYYIRVERFLPTSTAVTDYTLTVTMDAVALCTTDADCDDEFSTQLYRRTCTAGACVAFDGGAAGAFAALCDSSDDCSGGAVCLSALRFASNNASRAVCSKECTQVADCAGLTNAVCNPIGQTSYCTVACATDSDCGVLSVGADPMGQTWKYGTCNAMTGICTY